MLKIYGKVICFISSVETRKAFTIESKILASIKELMLTAVKDFKTNDQI